MYNKMFDEYDGVAGDVLKVAFEVELDEGFIYGSSPVVHVDNTYNDLIYSPFNNQRKKRFVFNYTVPVPEGGRYIRTVSENIALPIEGAIPEFQTESMASAQAKGRAKPHDPVSLYTVNQVFWIEVDPEGESMNFMTPTDRFKGGYYYYLILAMTPNDGYQFSEKTKVILNSATYSETATISLNAKQETNGFIDIEGPVAGVFFHLEKTTPTAIQEPKLQVRDSRWYTIDGRPLGSEPTAPGIYIRNGRKVVIGK
jgi:hypothetical protein